MCCYTIMLVEDDYLIRMLASEFLQNAGYRVLEADHADQALYVLAEHAPSVHILFTDMHMPGMMDGLALAHHAKHHWPWIRSLLVSGRGRPPVHRLPEDCGFMQKPYSGAVMVDHMQVLLGNG